MGYPHGAGINHSPNWPEPDSNAQLSNTQKVQPFPTYSLGNRHSVHPRLPGTAYTLGQARNRGYVRAASYPRKEIRRKPARVAALYSPQGSSYGCMIAFAWENAGCTDRHTTGCQGSSTSAILWESS